MDSVCMIVQYVQYYVIKGPCFAQISIGFYPMRQGGRCKEALEGFQESVFLRIYYPKLDAQETQTRKWDP